MNIRGTKLPTTKLDKIKLVVCDMDGTALNSKKELSAYTQRVFNSLRDMEIACTIASARTPKMLGVFCKQFGIDKCPVITLEGGLVLNWGTGEIIHSRPLFSEAVKIIIEYIHSNGLDYTAYTAERSILRRNSKRIWRFTEYSKLAKSYGLPPVITEEYEDINLNDLAEEGVYKIFVDNPDEGEKLALISMLETIDNIRTDCSEGHSITVMHKDVSKGNALLALTKKLGLSREEICCFGDWYNDIDMLSAFPNSVAMLNGVDAAKTSSGYITLSNDDDGVAFFIDNFIL